MITLPQGRLKIFTVINRFIDKSVSRQQAAELLGLSTHPPTLSSPYIPCLPAAGLKPSFSVPPSWKTHLLPYAIARAGTGRPRRFLPVLGFIRSRRFPDVQVGDGHPHKVRLEFHSSRPSFPIRVLLLPKSFRTSSRDMFEARVSAGVLHRVRRGACFQVLHLRPASVRLARKIFFA